MLKNERREQKRDRKFGKQRRKSNRKALQVIIDAAARRKGKAATRAKARLTDG